MMNMLSKISFSFVMLFLGGCELKSQKGIFYGEANFENFIESYPMSMEEARSSLDRYLNESGLKFRSFPYDVVYAHNKGYLFVEGEFKLHISLEGYFVDHNGVVSWQDLERAVDIKDYKGNRKWRR